MDELYALLKKYPDYGVTLCWSKEYSVLNIRVVSSRASAEPGLDTNDTETEFQAQLQLAITIAIPQVRIEAANIDLMLAEVEWALEELQSIQKE